MSIAAELKEKYPVLFEALMTKIGEDENPEEEINRLNRAYEDGATQRERACPRSQRPLPWMVSAKPCSVSAYPMIRGIGKATSSGAPQVNEVMAKLKASPFIFNEKGVLQFDADKAVNALDLKS